ncbi:zona pellucida-like domain-containing protein 1 [Aplochiton taeniatus]
MLIEIFFLAITVARSSQLTITECGAFYRKPEYTDISVECGTNSVGLAIQLCPAMYTGYNESQLILNYLMDPACKGTLDTSVSPPVVRFRFPLNMTSACGSIFRTTSTVGTGVFSDFSNIQSVNVSGIVRSFDPTTGMVTYNTELRYYYSCVYPLEYLLNNTRADVSGSSIAVKDNNGSFISTLSLELFSDLNYTKPLIMPPLGIELRSKVYAQVKATNLTGQYNVLLDRCYASISPLPTNSSFFNLFVPCNVDQLTTMLENGVSQRARFTFSAFRFLEQQNQTVSTYYLHCITRLCEKSTCASFQVCNRRKRSASGSTGAAPGAVPASATGENVPLVSTLTSPEIITKIDSINSKVDALASSSRKADSTVGLEVAVGILTVACIAAVIAAVIYRKRFHV